MCVNCVIDVRELPYKCANVSFTQTLLTMRFLSSLRNAQAVLKVHAPQRFNETKPKQKREARKIDDCLGLRIFTHVFATIEFFLKFEFLMIFVLNEKILSF